VLSPFNRKVSKTWHLEQFLLKYGFLDENPIAVTRLPDGRLQIEDGHNRFYAAQKYGIPIKDIEVDKEHLVPQSVRDGTHTIHAL
jgi:hypothetical protein